MNARLCCHCGAPVAPQSSACSSCRKLLIVNNRYGLRRQIGRGGFGTVFEGTLIGLSSRCAIKLIQVNGPRQQEQIETEIGILQRNAAGLSFVPHIYGAWKHGSIIYIVMEFIDGQTLDPDRWPPGYWHPERVRRFLSVMLKNLEQLHVRGIIHRDLNPNNIMRTNVDKQYKLLDFGIAKPGLRTQTIVRGVGTLQYSPIEQLQGQTTTASSDLYSLGVVAYHLLVGEPPPDAMERLGGKLVIRPSAQILNVPPELDRTIMALIGLRPDERPQSATAALNLLNGGIGVPPPLPRPVVRPRVAPPNLSPPSPPGLGRIARPLVVPPPPPRLDRVAPPQPVASPPAPRQAESPSGLGGFVFALVIIGALLWLFVGGSPLKPASDSGAITSDALASFGGGKLAFSSRRANTYHLFVISSEVITPTAITDGARDDFAPVWSPDGRTLAFVGSANNNDDIYRINSDGSDLRNLTNNPAVEGTPVWSPDGSRIAFESDRDGNYELYLMDSGGSNVQRFTNNSGIDRSPIWLGNNEIFFVSQRGNGWGIYRASVSGRAPIPILTSTQELRFPTLSPDGQILAYAMEDGSNWDVYKLAIGGDLPVRLTDDPAEDTYPSWSPNGQAITFMSTRDANASDARRSQLYIMRADGSEQQRMLDDDFDNRHPAWAVKQ